MENKIPLVDLHAQYQAYKDEFDTAIERVIRSSGFVGGAEHDNFALEFAEFCGGGYVIPCANGTDAIYLAIHDILGKGDGSGEIITVSHTFIATTEAMTQAGYRPVFVEIDPQTYVMDVSRVEAAITPKTRAIVPVHLYGQMVDMERLMEIARRHNLPVIEDAAQAHGASWKGKGPGMWGDAATFSFYPGKNLGAWGDGGAIFTRDPERVERIKSFANHGRAQKHQHQYEGVNSRLDGMQAAVLRTKLRHLKDWNKARRQIAAWYTEFLGDSGVVQCPYIDPSAEHVFHIYALQVEKRDEALEHLKRNGIDAGIHYPIPLHEQPAYRYLNIPEQAFPITHNLARRELSLPVYAELSREQAKRVADSLLEFYRK